MKRFRGWLARRLDPELAENEWNFEFQREQHEHWMQARDPLCSLYRDDVHIGFALNYGLDRFLISEAKAGAFVAVHAGNLEVPVGMMRTLIFVRAESRFGSRKRDDLYFLPRYDFEEAR